MTDRNAKLTESYQKHPSVRKTTKNSQNKTLPKTVTRNPIHTKFYTTSNLRAKITCVKMCALERNFGVQRVNLHVSALLRTKGRQKIQCFSTRPLMRWQRFCSLVVPEISREFWPFKSNKFTSNIVVSTQKKRHLLLTLWQVTTTWHQPTWPISIKIFTSNRQFPNYCLNMTEYSCRQDTKQETMHIYYLPNIK